MKKNKVGNSGGARPSRKDLVVESRRISKLPLIIPFEEVGVQPEDPEPEDPELEEARQYFKGTTPQGRDIIRKITIMARRKLFESSPGAGAARPAVTPQLQPSNSASPAPGTASPVGPARVSALPAPLPPPAAVATQPSTPAGPAIKSVAAVATPPLQPAGDIEGGLCSATEAGAFPQPWFPVGGCSMEEARRIGLVRRR
jgi:hypothetical protein